MLKRVSVCLCCLVLLCASPGCKLVQVLQYIGEPTVRELVDTGGVYLLHVMEDELAGVVEE